MPDIYQVILSPQAFDDLNAILEYIKQDSPQNASRVIDRLQRTAESLTELPHRYKTHRNRRRPELVIRAMPVPPFVIYYRVVEESSTVHVLTMRHGPRRKPSRL